MIQSAMQEILPAQVFLSKLRILMPNSDDIDLLFILQENISVFFAPGIISE
jgi:hypothetical protein